MWDCAEFGDEAPECASACGPEREDTGAFEVKDEESLRNGWKWVLLATELTVQAISIHDSSFPNTQYTLYLSDSLQTTP